MEFEKVLNERYSCRKYLDRQIEDEVLERVLDAGRICPTARNCQPQRVYVLQSEESRGKAAAVTPCTFDAPTLLLICSDTEQACPPREDWKDYNQIDPSIATSFMMLAATNEGLGSCMVCMFDAPDMQRAFDLPEHIVPLCLLTLGYPAEDAVPSNMHGERNAESVYIAARI